jgi:hypothetical protein
MIRYGFSIRTRSGQRVENISILAATRDDAERRLRQMYQKCQVVDCSIHAPARQAGSLDLATVVEMMSASEPPGTISPRFPDGVSR